MQPASFILAIRTTTACVLCEVRSQRTLSSAVASKLRPSSCCQVGDVMTHRSSFVIACCCMLPTLFRCGLPRFAADAQGRTARLHRDAQRSAGRPRRSQLPADLHLPPDVRKGRQTAARHAPEKLGPFHFNHRGEAPPPMKIGERYLVAAKSSQGAAVVRSCQRPTTSSTKRNRP